MIHRDTAAAAILGRRAEEAFDIVRADAPRAEFNALMATAGVGPKTRQAVWKTYADDTPHVLAGDPYRLVREVPGFSFALADALADTVGAWQNDACADIGRARAGLDEALHRLAKADGHTGATVALLVRQATRLLKVAPQVIHDAIRASVAAGHLYEGAWHGQPLIQTKSLHHAEQGCATAVAAKLRQPLQVGDFDAAIAHGEAATGFKLDDSQRRAAVLGLTQPICLIDGPPGTGKSTVVAVIIAAQRYLTPPAAIELCAPVGKAAERIEEITGGARRLLVRGGLDLAGSDAHDVDSVADHASGALLTLGAFSIACDLPELRQDAFNSRLPLAHRRDGSSAINLSPCANTTLNGFLGSSRAMISPAVPVMRCPSALR